MEICFWEYTACISKKLFSLSLNLFVLLICRSSALRESFQQQIHPQKRQRRELEPLRQPAQVDSELFQSLPPGLIHAIVSAREERRYHEATYHGNVRFTVCKS